MSECYNFNNCYKCGLNVVCSDAKAYQQGRVDAIKQYTCYDDCTSDNCSMCIRWNKLADFYETAQIKGK